MTEKRIYVIIDKKECVCYCTTDKTQASSILGIHRNTIRNRLKKGYFENNHLILTTAILHKSNKGGHLINFKLNEQI
jgi:hypothetical protein